MNPQDFSKNHAVALIVILCVLALGACYLSFALMSELSGWHTLSKRFGLNDGDEFDGITEGMQSGRMGRFGRYQNSLRLGANDEGLYVSVPGLFMHPPLFVPWREIKIARQKRALFGEYVTLTLGNEDRIPLRIGGSSALMLEESAGTKWPEDRRTS